MHTQGGQGIQTDEGFNRHADAHLAYDRFTKGVNAYACVATRGIKNTSKTTFLEKARSRLALHLLSDSAKFVPSACFVSRGGS